MIANNAPITPAGAKKAAQFLQLCDQSDTPVLFLQNTTGFLVGVEAEQQGQVKHGAKLIQAVANARVPQITLVSATATAPATTRWRAARSSPTSCSPGRARAPP